MLKNGDFILLLKLKQSLYIYWANFSECCEIRKTMIEERLEANLENKSFK